MTSPIDRLAVAVPMKPLAQAKQRLRPALDDAQRQILARAMFEHVLGVVAASGVADLAVVISADDEVFALARAHGFAALAEAETGYNAAAAQAAQWAMARGATALLVLPADLPRLSVEQLRAFVCSACGHPTVVIAPDAGEAGTNALLLRPPDLIAPGFGPDSFARHCALARAAGIEPLIMRAPAFAHDIDLPADLEQLAFSR